VVVQVSFLGTVAREVVGRRQELHQQGRPPSLDEKCSLVEIATRELLDTHLDFVHQEPVGRQFVEQVILVGTQPDVVVLAGC